MRLDLWLERLLLLAAFLFAATTAIAYWMVFGSHSLGGPTAWAEFGDYFGGVLNPLIGLLTVILVVLTLRTTRKEAADTRSQMAAQIRLLERQGLLLDMQKRLDGLLEEWNRLLDQNLPGGFSSPIGYVPGLGLESRAQSVRSVRDYLEDITQPAKLKEKASKSPHLRQDDLYVPPLWKDAFHPLITLLGELDEYCLAYENLVGDFELTKFYKRRVAAVLRTLNAANLIAGTVVSRLQRVSR